MLLSRFCLLACLLTLLISCGPKPPLPPVENHSFYGAPPVRHDKYHPSLQRKTTYTKNGKIKVKKGDTIYGIARTYGLDIKALIHANHLHPPYILSVGQYLTPPKRHYHIVKKGDTLYGISHMYGVQLSELVKINHIGPPYALSVGQKLILPSSSYEVTSSPTHIALLKKQRIKDKKNQHSNKKQYKAKLQKAPKRSSSRFGWPVRGQILSSYGSKPNGLHNDGINIKAPYGSPVKVVENGIVAYAGNGIKSFGTLILVKHDGGWVSAYGHLKDARVHRGQQLTKGQIIGTVGKKQNIPQIHFELRCGKKAVNPINLMR